MLGVICIGLTQLYIKLKKHYFRIKAKILLAFLFYTSNNSATIVSDRPTFKAYCKFIIVGEIVAH